MPILCTARERPRLPLRREVDFYFAFGKIKRRKERERAAVAYTKV